MEFDNQQVVQHLIISTNADNTKDHVTYDVKLRNNSFINNRRFYNMLPTSCQQVANKLSTSCRQVRVWLTRHGHAATDMSTTCLQLVVQLVRVVESGH